jgi:hypothetical protein
LLNVYIQIENKMGFQKKQQKSVVIHVAEWSVRLQWLGVSGLTFGLVTRIQFSLFSSMTARILRVLKYGTTVSYDSSLSSLGLIPLELKQRR